LIETLNLRVELFSVKLKIRDLKISIQVQRLRFATGQKAWLFFSVTIIAESCNFDLKVLNVNARKITNMLAVIILPNPN